MRVKPTQGCTVRDPFTRMPLPESGAEVADNSFWRRRVLSGDVVACADAIVETVIPQASASVQEVEPQVTHKNKGGRK